MSSAWKTITVMIMVIFINVIIMVGTVIVVYQCFGFFCLDLVSTMEIKICMRQVNNLRISFDIGFVFNSNVDSTVSLPCLIVIEYWFNRWILPKQFQIQDLIQKKIKSETNQDQNYLWQFHIETCFISEVKIKLDWICWCGIKQQSFCCSTPTCSFCAICLSKWLGSNVKVSLGTSMNKIWRKKWKSN